MTDIKSMTVEELKGLMAELGEKPFRAKQIYSWLHEHLVTSYDRNGKHSKEPQADAGAVSDHGSGDTGCPDIQDRRHQEISVPPV